VRTEEQLIPFQSADLTGRRVLVLAPHPDDETIGCGGSLSFHVDSGDPVKVVFLTNGAKGDTSGETEKGRYVALRRGEAKNACDILGLTDLEFWPYEDRSLAGSRGALPRMMDLLKRYRPELVYAPSPLEFHPDHRAACFLLCDAMSGTHFHFEVAFYELGQPVCVNTLVDITPVLDRKNRAISCYQSQLKEQPYGDIVMGLNRYRSMTLPEGVTHAEGFSCWPSRLIEEIGPLSIPFHGIHRLAPDAKESGPLVSIIVRTKDRPNLLANAIKSVATQTYANLELVVINDGGKTVQKVAHALAGDLPIRYVDHKKCLGRSAAANSGLKAASGKYLNFLDDDDILYPHHVATLVNRLDMTREKVAFSNVLNVFFSGPPENPQNREKEELVFAFDFDPDRLLFENYIPIMSVLFSRETLKQIDGFSTELTLFEDWDFWIRLSRHFSFQHVDETTAEYRFYGKKDMEASHRFKYRYDQARALLFDRTLPHMDGRAWANYRKEADLRASPSTQQPKNLAVRREPGQPRNPALDLHREFETLRREITQWRQTDLQHRLKKAESEYRMRVSPLKYHTQKPILRVQHKFEKLLQKMRLFCRHQREKEVDRC
jgi:LmbE family N-acetylglucosaminyl deacetylase/glycosyltransferase involved in cell wall biosynthesis